MKRRLLIGNGKMHGDGRRTARRAGRGRRTRCSQGPRGAGGRAARRAVRRRADRGGKLLGASIVASDGDHSGHLVTLAIERGMGVADFADQPWHHPTVAELLQTAARDPLGTDE